MTWLSKEEIKKFKTEKAEQDDYCRCFIVKHIPEVDKKLKICTLFSKEMYEDNDIDIDDYLIGEMQESFINEMLDSDLHISFNEASNEEIRNIIKSKNELIKRLSRKIQKMKKKGE